MARIWVPTEQLAAALAGLDGVTVDVVVPDGGSTPAGAGDVEFYVPPFFPDAPAVAVLAELPRLKVIQMLTAGVDRLRPHVPAGALLCNARGVHDASTAEWVVADGEPGPVTMRLREELIGIQYGHRPDPFGWVHKVC